jgi:hypothetical protein
MAVSGGCFRCSATTAAHRVCTEAIHANREGAGEWSRGMCIQWTLGVNQQGNW